MSYEIQSNSAEVLASNAGRAEAADVRKPRGSYPFAKLNEGQSFAVPIGEANVHSLRTRCSQLSVEGKRFVVYVHEGVGLVEIARLADRVAQQANIYQTGDALAAKHGHANVGKNPEDFYAPGFNPNNHDWNSQ